MLDVFRLWHCVLLGRNLLQAIFCAFEMFVDFSNGSFFWKWFGTLRVSARKRNKFLPPDSSVFFWFPVFFILTFDQSRVPTEETALARPGGNLECAASRQGSSYCWP